MTPADAFVAARPPSAARVGNAVSLFLAIRRHDRDTVARLMSAEPTLVEATPKRGHGTRRWRSGSRYAERGTPLVRAVQAGDRSTLSA